MKTRKLFCIVAMLGATGTALAQPGSEYVEVNDPVSTKTRAEVKAELARAQTSGERAHNGELVDFAPATSTLSRAQVRAEIAKAYYAGELRRNTEWVEYTNFVSIKTREEVRNEVLQAAKPR